MAARRWSATPPAPWLARPWAPRRSPLTSKARPVSAGLAVPHRFGVSLSSNPGAYLPLAGVTGAAVGGAVNQTGKAFQRGAANLGEQDVNAYMRHLSGSPAPVPGAAINRNDLAQMLFAQDLERIAPRLGSAVIGDTPDEKKDPDKLKRVYITKD